MAEDTDTPSEMYVDEIYVYEWDEFFRIFGFYPDESDTFQDEEDRADYEADEYYE